MTPLLRLGTRGLAGALLLAGTATTVANAQSPGPALCTPGAASNANASLYRLGITNVTLGSINNTTAGYADGYRDYSATQQTALVVGRSYTLSVTSGSTALAGAGGGENTGAWIDYNNDGSFNGANELVLAVGPAPAGGANPYRIHSISFTVPGTAVTGVPLRLRVNSDFVNASPLPGPCTTPQYSQCEDYAVTLGTNSSPPVAAFTASTALTCDGCVQFTDASQNVPTAWSWDFGDNSPVNTTQNPRYCYPTPGTYNVTLTVTNAAGPNTSAATAITYDNAVPIMPLCQPVASSPLGAYGVVRFRLGTIDNASTGATGGYQDFVCTQRARLIAGRPYPLTLDLASPVTANQDTKVYLDLNGNGIFESGDLLATYLSTGTPGGSITLPAAALLNQPLRLRPAKRAGRRLHHHRTARHGPARRGLHVGLCSRGLHQPRAVHEPDHGQPHRLPLELRRWPDQHRHQPFVPVCHLRHLHREPDGHQRQRYGHGHAVQLRHSGAVPDVLRRQRCGWRTGRTRRTGPQPLLACYAGRDGGGHRPSPRQPDVHAIRVQRHAKECRGRLRRLHDPNHQPAREPDAHLYSHHQLGIQPPHLSLD